MSKETKAQTASNPFAHFGTNKKKEDSGVWIDFGHYGFQVRRLGPSNKRFAKMLEAEMRPYKSIIKRNKLEDSIADGINHKVFATTVLTSWRRAELDADGNRTGWKKGAMLSKTGEDIPFTVDNAIDLFVQLPDLFTELFELAKDSSTFRSEEEAQVAGN